MSSRFLIQAKIYILPISGIRHNQIKKKCTHLSSVIFWILDPGLIHGCKVEELTSNVHY